MIIIPLRCRTQFVSLADVYDALTSERVYKKAFSHETAMNMILNGECGIFNPILIQCLKDTAEDIISELKENSLSNHEEKDLKNAANEMLRHNELSSTNNTLNLLEYERTKSSFFSSISDNILFEYVFAPSILNLSPYGAKSIGLQEVTVNPENYAKLHSLISEEDFLELSKKLRSTTPDDTDTEYTCRINYNGSWRNTKIICKTIWSDEDSSHYTGVIGKLIDLDKKSFDSHKQ